MEEFESFLNEVAPEFREFVKELDEELRKQGCKFQMKQAKSGLVVSYTLNGKVLANYVFRKTGLRLRVYGDHIGAYPQWLSALPEGMAKALQKAPPCKRLETPGTCNEKCAMGYVFQLEGKLYQKCRYNAFFFPLSGENNPFLRTLLLSELSARKEQQG